jgi:hypothetical protein
MRNSDGTFAEGNTGRKAGSLNRATKDIRDAFTLLIENNIDTLQEDLNELEPKDRIKLLLNLSNFIIPKMKSVDLKADKAETILIDFSESIGWDKTDEEN